jgi:hypothetical protein
MKQQPSVRDTDRVSDEDLKQPVIEVGTIPDDLVIIKPRGSKFGLETFTETAFGLRIDVDAFGDVVIHVNWSVSLAERFGCLKTGFGGNGDGRDCDRLGATSGWAGENRESFPVFSQFVFTARFNLRR